MSQVLGKEGRPLLKACKPIARPVKDARHTQSVRGLAPAKDAQVARSQYLCAGREPDAVGRGGDKAPLSTQDGKAGSQRGACRRLVGVDRAVIVHDQALVRVVDVHVRRRDVSTAGRLTQLQRARAIDSPRACQPVCIGQADVLTLVVGKVEIVLAQGIRQPLGHADQRGAVDIVAHAVIHMGVDDRVLGKASDVHESVLPDRTGQRGIPHRPLLELGRSEWGARHDRNSG